jgi:hypothetical protein
MHVVARNRSRTEAAPRSSVCRGSRRGIGLLKVLTHRTLEIGARLRYPGRGSAISPVSVMRDYLAQRPALSEWRAGPLWRLVLMLGLCAAAFAVVFTAGSGGTTGASVGSGGVTRAPVAPAATAPQAPMTIQQLTATPTAPALRAKPEAAAITARTLPAKLPVQPTSNAAPAAPSSNTSRAQVALPVPPPTVVSAPPSAQNVASSRATVPGVTSHGSGTASTRPISSPSAPSPGTGTASGGETGGATGTGTSSGGETGTSSGGGTGTSSGSG